MGDTGAAAARGRIEAMSPPLAVRDPAAARGLFDHRYDAVGRADVPSDGQPHRVSVAVGERPCTMRWRTVPRELAEVFREVDLVNPLDAPLLAGPIDVYVEGSLLTTTSLDGIDRGGKLTLGLGVEDRIRVARNARASEDTVGLLGGATEVSHVVTVELKSSLGRAAVVEVIDRLPVSDEKGIEVSLERSSVPGEKYAQVERGAPIRGGMLWRVSLAAAGSATLELAYKVTLSSKHELVGGNRRE